MQPGTAIRLCSVSASSVRSFVLTPLTLSQTVNALRSVSIVRRSPMQPLMSSSSLICYSRSFHSSSPNLSSSSSLNADAAKARAADWTQNAVHSVQNASQEQLKHWSNIGLAAGIPLALILSPSKLAIPFDLALGFALPLHMHFGLAAVIDDYVPRSYRSYAHIALLIFSAGVTIGALKINLCGPGIAESVKALWRSPKPPKVEEKKPQTAPKK